MQSMILDFASEKIAKSLNKIEKDDVRNVFAKFRKQEKVSQKDSSNVNNVSEEYTEMLKNESSDKDNPSNLKESSTSQKNETECSSINVDITHNEEEISSSDDDEETPCPKDPERINSGEVQSFIQKKNLAQGMMDLALVSANCNQLRYVLDSRDHHPYFFTSLFLIISSLALQVTVGLVLLYSNRFNLKRQSEMKSADNCGLIGIYGVFLITLINFLISAFSGANTVLVAGSNSGPDPGGEMPVV